MDALTIAEQNLGRLKKHYPAFAGLAKRYRDDAMFRSRIDAGNTAAVLGDLGLRVPPGIETRLVANTPGTFHFVLPPDPNAEISEESLSTVSAGGKSAGSLGTVGCFGCATGTVSTVSSTTTAGTALE